MVKRFRNAGSRNDGFTLSELLVVIAIMAILVGVAVGSFTGLMDSGKSESVKYELEAVTMAVESYMAVNVSGTITARDNGAVIAAGDSDAPFETYIRKLPTEYRYVWDSSGSVSRVLGDDGGGGGCF